MQYSTTKHLDMDSKAGASNSPHQVNIAQGRAHHNTFQHIHTTSPLHIQEEESMQT